MLDGQFNIQMDRFIHRWTYIHTARQTLVLNCAVRLTIACRSTVFAQNYQLDKYRDSSKVPLRLRRFIEACRVTGAKWCVCIYIYAYVWCVYIGPSSCRAAHKLSRSQYIYICTARHTIPISGKHLSGTGSLQRQGQGCLAILYGYIVSGTTPASSHRRPLHSMLLENPILVQFSYSHPPLLYVTFSLGGAASFPVVAVVVILHTYISIYIYAPYKP